MSNKKIIAVFGATGAQGGGLARAILNDPNSEFSVRALTRDVNSDAAKALAAKGAEVVSVDLADANSVAKAFEGAYGAFCVTFYWAHFSPDRELAEAETMANAAKKAGLKHVIWSTLEDTRKFIPLHDDRMPTLMERFKVPHFDAKGEGDESFIKAGVPTTFLMASFYWENMIYFGMGPKYNGGDTLTLTMPMADAKLSGIAAEDIGKCAYGIFKNPAKYIGQTIGVAGDQLTGTEIASDLSQAFGKPVVYNSISPATYRGFGFPGADDLGNMFQFYAEFESHFADSRNLEVSRELNPQLQTFPQWLAEKGKQIPLDG